MAKKKVPATIKSNSKDRRPIEKEKITEAHNQADNDIDQDPDMTSEANPEDELDEGELARLEGEY